MPKRIFISLEIDSSVKDEIANWQEKTASSFDECPIKWTPRENLHLTLHFLGTVSETQIIDIKNACLETSKKISAFKITTDGFNFWPKNSEIPEMIWLYCQPSKDLSSLHQMLKNIFLDKQINTQTQDFIPHISIGKVIKWAYKNIDPETLPSIAQEMETTFLVSKFNICESLLRKPSAQYKIIESFNLSDLS